MGERRGGVLEGCEGFYGKGLRNMAGEYMLGCPWMSMWQQGLEGNFEMLSKWSTRVEIIERMLMRMCAKYKCKNVHAGGGKDLVH